MPTDAAEVQVKETKQAFYAGAQHLFSCIIHGLDSNSEPTAAGMKRMSDIAKELNDFAEQFRDAVMPAVIQKHVDKIGGPKGRA